MRRSTHFYIQAGWAEIEVSLDPSGREINLSVDGEDTAGLSIENAGNLRDALSLLLNEAQEAHA